MKQERALKTAAVYETARKQKGMKDVDVARESGVTSSTISDWKKGRYTPKADKLLKISKVLGIPVDCFLE